MLVMNYNGFNFSAFNAFSTLQEIEQHLEWDLNPNNNDNSEDGDSMQCHFITLMHFLYNFMSTQKSYRLLF